MTKTLVWSGLLTLVGAVAAPAQDLTCRGVAYDVPGADGGVISLDLRRKDDEWKALHGRVGEAGSLRPTSISLRRDSLTVVFDELHATYAGLVGGGGTVIRGAWTKAGTRMPLNVRCRADAPFPDTTRHTVRYVSVENGVQLEVIDWGGTGRPVVLLHGMNATAHVFDDFAPELTRDYHVYGITRRAPAGRVCPTAATRSTAKGMTYSPSWIRSASGSRYSSAIRPPAGSSAPSVLGVPNAWPV